MLNSINASIEAQDYNEQQPEAAPDADDNCAPRTRGVLLALGILMTVVAVFGFPLTFLGICDFLSGQNEWGGFAVFGALILYGPSMAVSLLFVPGLIAIAAARNPERVPIAMAASAVAWVLVFVLVGFYLIVRSAPPAFAAAAFVILGAVPSIYTYCSYSLYRNRTETLQAPSDPARKRAYVMRVAVVSAVILVAVLFCLAVRLSGMPGNTISDMRLTRELSSVYGTSIELVSTEKKTTPHGGMEGSDTTYIWNMRAADGTEFAVTYDTYWYENGYTCAYASEWAKARYRERLEQAQRAFPSLKITDGVSIQEESQLSESICITAGDQEQFVEVAKCLVSLRRADVPLPAADATVLGKKLTPIDTGACKVYMGGTPPKWLMDVSEPQTIGGCGSVSVYGHRSVLFPRKAQFDDSAGSSASSPEAVDFDTAQLVELLKQGYTSLVRDGKYSGKLTADERAYPEPTTCRLELDGKPIMDNGNELYVACSGVPDQSVDKIAFKYDEQSSQYLLSAFGLFGENQLDALGYQGGAGSQLLKKLIEARGGSLYSTSDYRLSWQIGKRIVGLTYSPEHTIRLKDSDPAKMYAFADGANNPLGLDLPICTLIGDDPELKTPYLTLSDLEKLFDVTAHVDTETATVIMESNR